MKGAVALKSKLIQLLHGELHHRAGLCRYTLKNQ